jgi:XTP/dITP diphosphohydrolase
MIARTVVVATGNKHKIEELTALLSSHGLDLHLIPMSSVAPDLVIDETGDTFEANAYIKAALVHAATGLPALADDSGLEVHALGGAPGVRSARYSGDNPTDASNRDMLLERMQSHDERTAAFRCVLCYVDDARTVFGEGACHGAIARHEVGTNGFGYDPLFVGVGDDRSFAELTSDEKHARSHRGAAVADLARRLAVETVETAPEAHLVRDAMLRACVAAGIGNMPLLERALTVMHDATSARMMYEALLQCYLFGGFPAALDALAPWYEQASARSLIDRAPEAKPFDVNTFEQRGEALCRTIYGSVYDRMMQRLGDVSPDLRSWVIIEGYGKTLSRDGLSIVDRELCNVAILAALGRRAQCHSHVRGALRVGATAEDLQDVVNVVTETCGGSHGDVLRAMLAELIA